MTKIGLAETVPAPCENEEVSLGSTFFVGMMDFPCFFRLLLFPHYDIMTLMSIAKGATGKL